MKPDPEFNALPRRPQTMVSLRSRPRPIQWACTSMLLFGAVLPLGAASPEAASDPLDLPTVVADAMAGPTIRAARARWEAAQERSVIARAWPDPMVTYGYFLSNVETRVGAQNQRLSLAQKIPFPGKLSEAGDRAAQEALVAMWRYRAQVSEVVQRAKSLYFELYQVDGSMGVVHEQMRLLEQVAETAQGTFESGTAELSDVLKVRLAKDDLRSRLITLQQQRAGVAARLSALLDRDPDLPMPTAAPELRLPRLPGQDVLYPLAEAHRQELQQAGVAVARDRLGVSLAKKERWPDLTLGADYTQLNDNIFSNPPDNGQDAFMVSLSVNLPIRFEKLRAQERMARKELAASREALEGIRLQVEAEVRDAWFQAQGYGEQVALYRELLLPQAEDAFEAAEASFSGGEGSLIDLLDSERSLLALRLGLVLNEARLGQALAALERAAGVQLSDFKSLLNSPESHGQTNE